MCQTQNFSLSSNTQQINQFINQPYKYGFKTIIDSETLPKGLNESLVKLISFKKNEPSSLLKFRLVAYRKWKQMQKPSWAYLQYPPINYEDIIYYSSPKFKKKLNSLEEVDPEILKTFDKLGISLNEQKKLTNVAVDAIFDSTSITTTFKKELEEVGIIFCSISEAIQKHLSLIKKYLGSVVSKGDNYFAALNSAVFSDGSFCYIPPNTRCPLELSTYFRINNKESGQFERTLIIADQNSYVSYLEGCTAPQYDNNQLHAAVVELIALDNAEIKYSTVQNWYAGNAQGQGGIYNFVTKRGLCLGKNSKISWTQIETGSAITWKYPGCVLSGNFSIGEFASVTLTNNYQQADTGSKMIHIGPNTRSKIISKGISAGYSKNSYRGLVKIGPKACYSKNYSQCDSLLLGKECQANTFPYIQVKNSSAIVEHEASISKIGEEQIFYFLQRGISAEQAVSLMISGFCRDVFNVLPMEFAIEADRLLNLKLEGTVG
jgi:Fe-S cluster assembly protein SufB|uniref:Iron-sulfur cluster assembly SufBD family protein ycf24 n=1 Tax=Thorea hispida TaxID=202687 RepID=A0A1C9CAC3_9FLOR|nr:cysteine desulfurase activator complex subunit SufB [Thorea hispida]AOM65342.1 cysteine desulfurase activator complex subunit SufB [Thorea hispida]ARX95902.1 cysteine desulfurase activator complex subunit SufB [Thorea hispida]UNJ79187.1 cysteine desulfurase activator complex subunit SufB [Thorea hispida]